MALEEKIGRILEAVAKGELSPSEALKSLRGLPYQDLGFAKIDHHRELRKGFPEVIYGAGKTAEQIIEIAQEIISQGSPLLITRLNPQTAQKVLLALPELNYYPLARIISYGEKEPTKGHIAIVTAGTADLPVAEEARICAQAMGNRTSHHYDVGVAGIHRLFEQLPELCKAKVVIVVAGMEGALASVVAGMIKAPVIAVPTSTGYGASLGGLAALLTMLNSCAPGVAVVNIDNGYGAACVASLINQG
ncbi:nickel pincer cofactor biosynthesis protein LarB [Thermosulfuriphilus sp.]